LPSSVFRLLLLILLGLRLTGAAEIAMLDPQHVKRSAPSGAIVFDRDLIRASGLHSGKVVRLPAELEERQA
jgi:hypothetical protein